MRPSSLHYPPYTWPFLLALFAILVIVLALVEFRILRYAYGRMGLSPRLVLAVLLLTFLGSYVNIPVAEVHGVEVKSNTIVEDNGVQYVVPENTRGPTTILAVNVGGALVPAVLSVYLLFKNRLWARGLLAILVVSVLVHWMAKIVPGVGITVPTFLPPIAAALTAIILGWRDAPALAYVGGSMGALIGADLSNLGRIIELKAPVAAIGGAGTFDAVFLTGILAVLIAPGGAPRPPEPAWPEKHHVPHDPLRL